MGAGHGAPQEKSRPTLLERVVKTLVVNLVITLAAVFTVFLLVKSLLIPAVNDATVSMVASQQKAIQKMQQDYQKNWLRL